MNDAFVRLAKLVAGKVVTWVLTMLLAVGIVVPASLSDEATAGLAVVIAVALQVLYQLGAAALEKYWPAFAASRIFTLRKTERR